MATKKEKPVPLRCVWYGSVYRQGEGEENGFVS